MPWSAEPNAGFALPGAEPWLPIGEDTADVAAQSADPRSSLTLHRRLLALRRAEDALSMGSYRTLSITDSVFAYERRTGDRRFAVALNLGGEPEEVDVPAGRLVLSTHLEREDEPVTGRIELRADEGAIAELAP
jgi:alpha-glucosidase